MRPTELRLLKNSPNTTLRRLSLLCAFAAGLLCLSAGPVSSAEQTLTILHTSEHHGQALPLEQRGQPKVGGMARRATLIAAVRREGASVLLVDSGDILVGTPLSSFFRGEPDIKAMNLMGYQAMVAGNHEFDFGLDHLRRLQELARFPILCSNLEGRGTALPCRPSAVVRVGSLSIGLIGLLGRRNFPDTFNQQVVKLLDFRDPVETGRTLARQLKAGSGADRVDVVVAVTHQETEEDVELLAQVPEIDAIIGGHTPGFDGLRTASAHPPVDATANPGPVFVKTHRQGRTLGRLDLVISETKVARATARNLPVTEEVAPDLPVHALIEEYAKKLESQTATVIGRSLVTLEGESSVIRTRETNLGNLLADLLRAEFGTEVALVNGGQIRDSIPAGPVDMKRVLRVLPFDSTTVTLTMTGEQLALALENSVSKLPGTDGRFLQVSGLALTYDPSSPAGSRVREITVGGRPLEASRSYSVATDVFLADGGDGYSMLVGARDRVERQIPMRDLLLQAVRAKPLTASLDGRIRAVGRDLAPHPSAHPGH
ncbi:MAG: bifunctional metallophosphatase/5'-nucleotidase [Nitrospiraceae bacterium]